MLTTVWFCEGRQNLEIMKIYFVYAIYMNVIIIWVLLVLEVIPK